MSVVGYASPSSGVHDRRWVEALQSCGFSVELFTGPQANAAEVDARLPLDAPVLAGPLPTVARSLIASSRPVVGLSYGWDLQPGHAYAVAREELAWLPALSRLIVDSPSTREVALRLGLPEERIDLIPWGIDLAHFSPAGPVAELGLPSGSRVILSLRRHDDLYRTADVIEAFAIAARRDPRLRLVMGGAGPLEAGHQDRVSELGLASRVTFIGHVAEIEVAALLRAADMYVTASETDGTSVTLLQAMACGVPIAASDNPGNDWWIEPGLTGSLFPIGDIDLLADLMLVLEPDGCVAAAQARVGERADWTANRQKLRGIMTEASVRP